MIDANELRLTEQEATNAAYGDGGGRAVNPLAMTKRRLVANAQLSKAVWTIVDQLRTKGTLEEPSMDDLMAAAILEQIAIIIGTPHPTTQKWFDYRGASSNYVQTADPEVVRGLESAE